MTFRASSTVRSLGGVELIHDYAHHPTEIEATLRADEQKRLRSIWLKKLRDKSFVRYL